MLVFESGGQYFAGESQLGKLPFFRKKKVSTVQASLFCFFCLRSKRVVFSKIQLQIRVYYFPHSDVMPTPQKVICSLNKQKGLDMLSKANLNSYFTQGFNSLWIVIRMMDDRIFQHQPFCTAQYVQNTQKELNRIGKNGFESPC